MINPDGLGLSKQLQPKSSIGKIVESRPAAPGRRRNIAAPANNPDDLGYSEPQHGTHNTKEEVRQAPPMRLLTPQADGLKEARDKVSVKAGTAWGLPRVKPKSREEKRRVKKANEVLRWVEDCESKGLLGRVQEGEVIGVEWNDVDLAERRKAGEEGEFDFISDSEEELHQPLKKKVLRRMGGQKTSRLWRKEAKARVATAYKRKDKKVQPVNLATAEGQTPGGIENWQEVCLEKYHKNAVPYKGRFSQLFNPRLAEAPVGYRLTPDRLKELKIGMELRPEELEMLHDALMHREGVMGFSFDDVGLVRDEVTPPLRIRTVEHEAWQAKGIKIPRAAEPAAMEILKEKLKNGTLERCEGPYRNPWFLVEKKNGKWRFIVGAQLINKVTLRDANMPPNHDEFAEDFAGLAIVTLADLLSGYDQLLLDARDRDLTAIMTILGLLRYTRVVQGGTNSVAQFVRVMGKILEDLIPGVCRVFLDDIGIKGPRTRYNDEDHPEWPGVRRFVFEHIVNVEMTFYLLELAGTTVSAEKTQFCSTGVKIVGWTCGYDGRKADLAKVEKIAKWPRPQSIRDLRAFIGTASYFRILIQNFQWKAAPLYDVLKTPMPKFRWGKEQEEAFVDLKQKLLSDPVVLPIDYQAKPLEIIVAVDASLTGWGAILMQVQRGRRHPARYESGIWTPAESNYDAGKRECRGALKALKKFKSWLYGIHFTLEIDSETLVAQLNRSATDLPGAVVTSWLAWMKLFDFTPKHVKGVKHGGPDGLSRRPRAEDELSEQTDIDEVVQAELGRIRARINAVSTSSAAAGRVLENEYDDASEEIAKYLTTLSKPKRMTGTEFYAFKKKAWKYLVEGRHLFRRGGVNENPRRVVDRKEDREEILKKLHEECGHKGREGTYHFVQRRYFWAGMYKDVTNWVKSCLECQFREPGREEEPLHSTKSSQLFRKVGIDVTYMPSSNGKSYLVVARDDFSHWPEARALKKITARAIRDFFFEEVVCRHGVPYAVSIDGGPENKGELQKLLEELYIKVIKISAFNSKGQGMIEVGHKPLQAALSKSTGGTGRNWPQKLSAALFADRCTVKASTGRTPFELLHGEDVVLPVELEIPTWQSVTWDKVKTTEELIAIRTEQILRRDKDLEEAAYHLTRMRETNREYFDDHHNVRPSALQEGDVVLLHNTKITKDFTRDHKLQYRWVGPYRIHAVLGNGSYKLKELDGAVKEGSIQGNRLKRFILRGDTTAREVAERISGRDEEDEEETGPTKGITQTSGVIQEEEREWTALSAISVQSDKTQTSGLIRNRVASLGSHVGGNDDEEKKEKGATTQGHHPEKNTESSQRLRRNFDIVIPLHRPNQNSP